MSEAMGERELERLPESIEPADAFSLLGNEIRMQILRALWAAPETPIAFSDLYRAVDVDDSAQFNYHLRQLTQHFVQRTDDGYRLRQVGEKVMQAVLAGSFTSHPTRTIEMVASCTQCSTSLHAIYEDEMLSIECPACQHGHGSYPFPPGGLSNRTDVEILEAFDHRVRHLHCLAKDGVCPECSGRMETTIETTGDCCLGATLRAEHVCEQCNHSLCSAVGLGLLDSSAVVAFYSRHGVDLGATPYWRLAWCVSDEPVTVRSREPWRIEISIELEDGVLDVVLDGDLAIRETNER